MYAHLQGKLFESRPSFVIVEAGGVGYKILISASCFSKLPQAGETIFLHTSFICRENSQALYGFLTSKERDVFEVLINISGIGPKLALSLVGHMTLADLHSAVISADAKSISRVPGVGKKTAERLIVEMKGKLPNMFGKDPSEYAIQISSEGAADLSQDIIGALINLGYNQAKAQSAAKKSLEKHSESADLSILIREALKFVN